MRNTSNHTTHQHQGRNRTDSETRFQLHWRPWQRGSPFHTATCRPPPPGPHAAHSWHCASPAGLKTIICLTKHLNKRPSDALSWSSLLLHKHRVPETLITNKCTKRVLSSTVTHSYKFRPCWVIFRENFLLSLH
jgi:hypothetical protein